MRSENEGNMFSHVLILDIAKFFGMFRRWICSCRLFHHPHLRNGPHATPPPGLISNAMRRHRDESKTTIDTVAINKAYHV